MALLPIEGGGGDAAGFEALRRSYADAGLTLVGGSFETGGTLNSAADVLLLNATAKAYAWTGAFPKVVPAGATPATSGGISAGAWVERTDVTLRSDLISQDGSSKVGFKQDGAGAVATTVQSKLMEFVSVKDFGAVGDGVADDTSAIQAAITVVGVAGGGSIYFPAGTYKISAQLNITYSSIRLVGSSRFSTLIKQTNLNSKTISITNNFFQLEHLSFMYDGTPVVGATALYCFGSNCTLKDFVIRNSYVAVEFDQGVAGKVTDFEILDYENIGLYAHNLNDLFVSRFIMNAGNESRGTLGGIRLVNKVEAFVCTDGDILFGSYSMTTDAGYYTIGNRPAYNNFTNVYFDSSVNGVSLERLVETEFVGCWFSGGRAGGGNPGCIVKQCDSLTFTNSRFFNCGGSGCAVTDLTKRTHFIGCKFESNSVTAGAGVAHGLLFMSNTTDFLVQGCVAHNGLYTGTQAYGIFISPGCDYFNVSDNNVRGNATGGILDGSSATAYKKIGGNIGYRTTNTGSATIMAGTTTIVVTHGLEVTPRQQDITLTHGSSNQGSTELTAQSITSTQFTIITAAAPSGDMVVNWMARCAGA